MASVARRCRPLLCTTARAARHTPQTCIRTRPRHFSSTRIALARKGNLERSDKASANGRAPRDGDGKGKEQEGRDDEDDDGNENDASGKMNSAKSARPPETGATIRPSGQFSTAFSKPKSSLRRLPTFIGGRFDFNAAEEEDDDNDDADAEIEAAEEDADPDEDEDFGEGWNPDEDVELMETGELSARDRAELRRARQRGETGYPAGLRDTVPEKQYHYVEDIGEIDEEGLPELEPGNSWVDKDLLLDKELVEGDEGPEEVAPPDEPGFFAMEEENDDAGEDVDIEYDDITSMAHAELEQHRELREFYRVIAWDMPLLWNQRQTYEPPTRTEVLRFRYTTYLGETHPAARKVVMDFQPNALPGLSQQQVVKLIKLLGVRYNPQKERAKMSCEMFPTAAQNKRWLGDTLDKLVKEAKNTEDMFADLPFDFRHQKVKRDIAFPDRWKMTAERRAHLDSLKGVRDPDSPPAQLAGNSVQTISAPRSKPESEEQPLEAQHGEPVPIPVSVTHSPARA